MSTPRKHHYLPQFYLEGFKIEPQRGEKPHIWQIEKVGENKYYSAAIVNTGCIRDFHTLDFTEKEPDHKSVEAFLSELESEQSSLVQAISESQRVEQFQIEPLSEFISLMRYRVPSFANHVEITLRSVVLDTFKIMYQAGKLDTPPPSLLKIFDSKGIEDSLQVKISKWKILSHMFEMGLSLETIGLLAKYNYQVYSANAANFFVTSDNPVAIYHPNYEKIRPDGVGLATKGVEVTFPLTSDTLIRAGHHLEPGAFMASAEEVKEFNRRTIIMGEHYIFSKAVEKELRHQVDELEGVRAGFIFDDLCHGDGAIHLSRFIPVH